MSPPKVGGWWDAWRVPQGPSGSQLQQEFDELKATQQNALMRQKWGSTVNTQTAIPPSGVPTVNPSTPRTVAVEVIAIGPFKEPRAIALEQFWHTFGATYALYPTVKWELEVGIGQASYTQVCSVLPPVVQCQSLRVRVTRYDSSPSYALVTTPLSAWAAPYVPRATPQHFLTTRAFMGNGFAACDLFPPQMATHVQIGLPAQGGSIQDYDLYLECLTVTGDESGSRDAEWVLPGTQPPVFANPLILAPCNLPVLQINLNGNAVDAQGGGLVPLPRGQVSNYQLRCKQAMTDDTLWVCNWFRG